MVDSKEIEELRALVFASIPAAARKVNGSSICKGQRRCAALETEEGEILSDEDAVVAVVSAPAVITRPRELLKRQDSGMHLDHPNNGSDSSTKQRGTEPVSMEFPSAIITESPNLVAVVPSHNQTMISKEICSLNSTKVSVISSSKDKTEMIRPFVRMDSAAKSEISRSNQQVLQENNGSRALKSAAGLLASTLPSPSLSSVVVRKEADAFLASLNLPSSSHLPKFTANKHNSLVIKFSDNDSDSDGEQDFQGSKERSSDKKMISNELQTATTFVNSCMSQTTSGLISKIDRVKKQIAAIERAKGSSSVSRPSKTTGGKVVRQLNLKPKVPSTTASSQMVPQDLENLRLQIAAKESEIKRRKQGGSKECSDNGIAPTSSWPVENLEASDAQLIAVEKPESGAGVEDICVKDIHTFTESLRKIFDDTNGLQEKDGLVVADGPKFDKTCLNARFSDSRRKHSSSKTGQLLPGVVGKSFDKAGNNESFTPKRKRQESDSSAQNSKKTKKKGTVSSKEFSVLPKISKGESICDIARAEDGNSGALIKVTGGIQSSQSKEASMPVQGMPMAVAAKQPFFVKDVHTGIGQRGSGSMDGVINDQILIASEITAANDIEKSDGVVCLDLACAEDLPADGVVDATSQLDSLPNDSDHMKHLSTHGLSPLRTMVEQPQKFGFPSRERKLHQAIGVSSAFSSLPVWDCCNANGQILPGVSGHALDFSDDSLWKLQEEEDAIDKELEEAQQHRQRCEIRERFARKQFRDAQEALHAANLQCEMLFQRREMLSASVKAAQIQLYSSRTSLKHKRALISKGAPACAGKKTSLWASITGFNANVTFHPMEERDHEGILSNFRNVLNQASPSQRFSPVGSFIAETAQYRRNDEDCRVNDNILEEAVTLNVLASDAMEVPKSQCVVVSGKEANMPAIPKLSLQDMSRAPEKSCSLGELSSSLASFLRVGERNPQVSNKDMPPTCAPEVAVNGSYGKNSNGFSSASFATELWRDGDQAHDSSEKSFFSKGQEINVKESISSKPLLCDHVPVVLDHEPVPNSIDDSLAMSMEIHPSRVSSCMLKSSEQEFGPESVGKMEGINDLSQELLHQCDAKKTDGSREQMPMSLKMTDISYSRQDSAPLGSRISKADNLPKFLVAEDPEMELDEVQESCKMTAFCDENLVTASIDRRMNASKKHELISSLDCEKERSFEGKYETELDSVSVIKKSTSLINLVTSVGLNLLFSHTPDSHSSDIWKQVITSDKADETDFSNLENFESPFHGYRCFRDVHQSMNPLTAVSKVDRLDPHKVLCVFEHRGKCNNDECIWQHKRDYMLSSSQKESHQFLEASKCSEAFEISEKENLDSMLAIGKAAARVDKSIVCLASQQSSWKWNWQPIKVPMYSLGSHFTKTWSSESLLPGMVSKQQLRAGMPFFGLHREASLDLPYLLDSSLKLPALNDSSKISRQLRTEIKLWSQDDGPDLDSLGDGESLLETALELFDYDIKVDKLELQKSVLYVLSRGLEANPGFVALWIVYLHLFSRWEKNCSNDDLFSSAFQHNDGSYELWTIFINSRGHLKERLEAYELAIISLGRRADPQGHASDSKSSLLLDLALQRLNCFCIADSNEEATSWIREFSLVASEAGQGLDRFEVTSSLTLVTCLTRSDLCILWICCAYAMLQHRIPDIVVESLGCKQNLFFESFWPTSVDLSSSASQVMEIMRIASSYGKGCMKLDVNEPKDENLQVAKEVFAINFVQCAAVCEGLHSSLKLAEKYFKMFPPSVELTLLRARLEQHSSGKMGSLQIFEDALSHWPLDRTGKMGLWNQYVECACEVKGFDFVKGLLGRCAAEICDSDIFLSVCGNNGTLHNDTKHSKCSQQQGSSMPLEVSSTLQSACQFLPLIVKRQLAKGFECSSQRYSFSDAVFAYVNLAFLETLNKDYKAARIALQNGLNLAVDADSIRYCLKEIALFTLKGLDFFSISSPNVHNKKMLGLVDRCIVESQLIGAVCPLSKGFCGTIKRRRVRQFVASLICPSPTDCSFLNSVLEGIHGSTLLPYEKYSWTDLVDVAEKLLEVSPSNVRLATSICRVVRNKLSEFDSKARTATLYWCTSLLIDSLCQASPDAPEPRWVEAGNFLKLLEVDSLLEEFYYLAMSVYPYSTSLWHGLLAVSRRTGKVESVLKSAKEKGVKLEFHVIS